MKVSLEHGKAVDALVSELQRQNWGFRSDYAHHEGPYGALAASDRRQPSPITPQVLFCKAPAIRPYSYACFPQLVVCELVLQTADGHTAMQVLRIG
jgi:hypothetical protein